MSRSQPTNGVKSLRQPNNCASELPTTFWGTTQRNVSQGGGGWVQINLPDMNPQREKFLNLKNPPARLNAEETAWYLGFAAHDVPVLVSKGLLKPLGHPASTAVKFFALVVVVELRNDSKWLSRATDTIAEHWRQKNARRAAADSTRDLLAMDLQRQH